MDKVEALAAAIHSLPPEEKQRLFALLAEQGDLPGQMISQNSATTQAAAESSAPQSSAASAHTPDYVLIFDGGSKGNPGLGYGSYALRRVQDGAQRLERLNLGDGYTNNEAEYDTLIAGLQDLLERIEAAGRQPQEFSLEVRGDSSLVIRQVQGRWRAKEPRMKERRDRCVRLLRHFGTVELKTQPREESVRVLGH
jgi:ribonuclease HI